MDWLGSLEDSETDSNSSEVLDKSSTKIQNIIARRQQAAVESAEESIRLPPPLFRRHICEERKTFVNKIVNDYIKEQNEKKCNAPKVTTEKLETSATERISSTPYLGNNNKIALEQSCMESPIHTFIRRIRSQDRTYQNDNSKICSTETSDSEGVNKAKSSRNEGNFTLGECLEKEPETTEKCVERKVVTKTSKVEKKQSKNGDRSIKLIANKNSRKQLPIKIQKRMSPAADKSDLKNNSSTCTNLNLDTRRTFISEVQRNDKAFDLDEDLVCEAIPMDLEFNEYSLDDFKFLMRSSPKQNKEKIVIIDNILIKSSEIGLEMKQYIPSDNNKIMSSLRKRKTTWNKYQTIAGNELAFPSTDSRGNLDNEFPNVSALASTSCNNLPHRKEKNVLQNKNKNAEADVSNTNALATNKKICFDSFKNCYVKLDQLDVDSECATKNNPEMEINSMELVSTDTSIKKKRGRPCKQVSDNKLESVVQFSITANVDRPSPITRSITKISAKEDNIRSAPVSEFNFVKPTKRPVRGKPKKSDCMNPATNRQIQETSQNDCVSKQITQLTTRKGKSPKGNSNKGTTPIQVQYISTSEAMDESIDNGKVRTRNATKIANKHASVISNNGQTNDKQDEEDISSTITRMTRNRLVPSYVSRWYWGRDSESHPKNSDCETSRAPLKPKPKKRLSTIAKKKEKVAKNQPSKVRKVKAILEEAQLLRERYEINMELENADNEDSSIRFDSSHVDRQDSNSSLATTNSSVYVANENVHKHFLFEFPPTNTNTDAPFITYPLPKDGVGKVGHIQIRPGCRKPNITLKKYNLTISVQSGTGIFKLQNQTVRLKEGICVRAYDGHEYAIINDGSTELNLIYFAYPSKI